MCSYVSMFEGVAIVCMLVSLSLSVLHVEAREVIQCKIVSLLFFPSLCKNIYFYGTRIDLGPS